MLDGANRFDLRLHPRWWIIGSATACCEDHLNAAILARKRRPVVVVDDEMAYA
jgi:hypothetical protein